MDSEVEFDLEALDLDEQIKGIALPKNTSDVTNIKMFHLSGSGFLRFLRRRNLYTMVWWIEDFVRIS